MFHFYCIYNECKTKNVNNCHERTQKIYTKDTYLVAYIQPIDRVTDLNMYLCWEWLAWIPVGILTDSLLRQQVLLFFFRVIFLKDLNVGSEMESKVSHSIFTFVVNVVVIIIHLKVLSSSYLLSAFLFSMLFCISRVKNHRSNLESLLGLVFIWFHILIFFPLFCTSPKRSNIHLVIGCFRSSCIMILIWRVANDSWNRSYIFKGYLWWLLSVLSCWLGNASCPVRLAPREWHTRQKCAHN